MIRKQTSLARGQTSLRYGQTSISSLRNGAVPALQLSASSIAESASIGAIVGALSVANGSGSYTFTITADPDNKFDISGSNLVTTAALDYETATSHSVTVQAANGVDTPLSATFPISVTNVVEGTLGPTTAGFTEGAAAGSLITNITGLDAGASETVVSVSPSTTLAIAGGNQLVVGLTPAAVGPISATLTTSEGRTLNITVTVASAMPLQPYLVATKGDSLTADPASINLSGLGIQSGDVIVMLTSATSAIGTDPTGFTLRANTSSGSHHFGVYTKTASGTETSITLNGTNDSITVLVFRGVTYQSAAISNTSGLTRTAAVASASVDDLLVEFLCGGSNAGASITGATYSGSGFSFLENSKTIVGGAATASIAAVGKKLTSAGVPAASAWVYGSTLPSDYKAGAILLRPV